MNNSFDAIVIGAGPAGMMAAGTAAQKGMRVLLLEKKERPGRKLMITGKGRCNVTNQCTAEEVIAAVPTNGRFLYSAMASFSPQDTMAFFEGLGVPLKVERGNRVFPCSDRAVDIVDALQGFVRSSGATVYTESPAAKLLLEDASVRGVVTAEGEEFYAPECSLPAVALLIRELVPMAMGFVWQNRLGIRLHRCALRWLP